MESVFRAAAIYIFLLLVFRVSGKRTLSETTAFDLILLLIISETTQQAMVDGDNSFTNAAVLITTLVTMDIMFSVLKERIPSLEPLLDGTAVILVRDGVPLKDQMERERVDVDDVLEAARQLQGIESLDQIKLAVLERDGKISVVPASLAAAEFAR